MDPVLHLPAPRRGAAQRLALRLAAAIGLVLFVALLAWAGGDGYRDGDGRGLSFLDALYYASVSVTTTGYGDITPVSDAARLWTVVLVTPARILFLILLVGTTLEVLAEGSRAAFRERLWRRTLRDHTIVCGYGTKGRAAIEVLRGHGHAGDRVVVIDTDPDRVHEATRDGHAAIHGDASRVDVLERAGIREAAAVIVAPHRDDSAVLITLTAREHAPHARITTAVREDDNRHLLQQSGADAVISSAGAAGRMLGFATAAPEVVAVLEDLMDVGRGLDLAERPVDPGHVGRPLREVPSTEPVIAVLRGGELLRFDDARCDVLQAGDRLVALARN